MAGRKKGKGKTIPLTDFLASESKLVTVRGTNWSEIVDKEEAETKPIVVDIGGLPTAPRGAVDIDYSNVPNNPPFVAHVANLSFEIDDEGLRRIFADLNAKSARVIREGMRSRGIGLVEFETREHLIEALKRTDKEVYGRKIRVNVSDKTDVHQTDGNRGGFGSRSHRPGGGEDRSDTAGKWKRAEPRSDDGFEDRNSGGSHRDRPNRDFGRSNMGGGSRDNQSGNDFGFGYPRPRGGDDRGGPGGGAGGRDYNRSGPRNRYQNDDDNRSNSGADRPRYSGRYSDTRDVRDRNKSNDETPDDQREPPRERPRLQLQPRTKPLEALQPLSGSSSSVNNVAANVNDSSISTADETSSLTNTSTGQFHDSSHDYQDDSQQQESNEQTSRGNASDDASAPKPTRGAGASIFGGAKPVDTAARELEIERKLRELQTASSEATNEESEEKAPPPKPYTRPHDREGFRGKRPSHNDEHRERDRDRKDEGRYGHGSDYHHKREHSGGRQYEEDPRKRSDDDHYRRGGGGGQDRYGGPPRRDNESGRTNRYQHSDRDPDRANHWHRERDDRPNDNNDFTQAGRPSTNTDSQSRHPPRGMARRTLPAEDDSTKLQLSNKFGMLGDDDVDDENDEAQSPRIEE